MRNTDTTKESFEGAALELPAAHQSAVRIDLDTWHELRQAVANREEWVRKMIESCDVVHAWDTEQERDEWAAKLATIKRLGEQLVHAKTIEIG